MVSGLYRSRAAVVRLLACLYLLLVLCFCLAALYTWYVSSWRGPWRDMWEVMPFLQKAVSGQAQWQDYWEQYGFSHRPLMSRWLWQADLRWFSASNWLLVVVSLAMQVVALLSVRRVLLHDETFSTWQRRIVLAGTVFCLLNVTQVFNFLHTFDVQWFLVVGLVTASLCVVLLSENGGSVPGLAWAWGLVFLASLNNFSALVMWPVEVLLLLGLRVKPRYIAVFCSVTVVYWLIYFYRLLPVSDAASVSVFAGISPNQFLEAAVNVLVVFPLWYLSNPLSFQLAAEGPLQLSMPWPWVAPAVVALLLLWVLWRWGMALLRRGDVPTAVMWLGLSLVLFGYGVSVVTALGRGFFWDNVYALRYQNIVLLFWVGVVLCLSAGLRWRQLGLLLGALLLMGVFAWNAAWYHDHILKMGNRTRDAHLALAVGLERYLSAIRATVSRSHLTTDSGYTLQQEAHFLRERRAGVFAEPDWTQLPTLESLATAAVCTINPSNSDVRGSDDSYARLSINFPVPVNYRVIVWFDVATTAPGLLIASRADNWWERVQQTFRGFDEYAGFAKQLPQQKPEHVYANDRGHWCRLML